MGLNDVALMVDNLVLGNDGSIQAESDSNEQEMESFSEDEKEKIFREYILLQDGIVDEEEIEERKVKLKELAKNKFSKKPKETTIDKTKKLLEKKLSLKEMMEKRGLAENTIIEHIHRVKKLYPQVNIAYLKPKQQTLDAVKKAIKAIKKKKREEDFMMDGRIKLKPIFVYLDEKISYTDIKLSLLFV